MVQRVNLDAMIPRADFATDGEEFTSDLASNFPIFNLESSSPLRSLLRKPDFQRETNHWTPFQIVSFLGSFLDNELIPSLILWKSPTYIFVIDGGHRLSALRAWIEDDYGDGQISNSFYKGEISDEQRRVAQRTRAMVERDIGRFTSLKAIVQNNITAADAQAIRARRLFARGLNLQWVQGSASIAESSFFKINSQGTPLDDTEEMLLRNRKKPFAIAARAILRAGTGHKYWSYFESARQQEIERLAREIFHLLFRPELPKLIRTLDLPLGGSASPVDALALLVELISVANIQNGKIVSVGFLADDDDGSNTANALRIALKIIKRITGNSDGSLGLHPAVYFYNERGKHSKFLFLGMVLLVSRKISDNNSDFFRKFTSARKGVEDFLIENKSLIGLLLQNTNKANRVGRVEDLILFIIEKINSGGVPSVEETISRLGLAGRVLDVKAATEAVSISDDTKSAVAVREAIPAARRCPICQGLMDTAKSISFDHKKRVEDGGRGNEENIQTTHPYCNQTFKN